MDDQGSEQSPFTCSIVSTSLQRGHQKQSPISLERKCQPDSWILCTQKEQSY